MPSERIQLLIDVVTGNSKSTLGKLKSDLAGADTATKKFGVATKTAGNFLKQNLALGAAAAGTAIAGFAAKSVSDFQDLALGAGQLRDRLGVTAEEASRLQEVADDLGVPVNALEASIGRMNKTAGNTPAAFDEIGAAIARNKDGTTDVHQTFLNVVEAIDAMRDPTERAVAAQKIFGRGWQQMSEIIGRGSKVLEERLAAVQDSKIVNDEQIAQARAFRDNVDDLQDSVAAITEKVGAGLVPVLNDLIGVAKSVGSAIAAIPFKEQAVEIAGWVTGIKPLTMGLSKANEVLEDVTGTTHGSIGAMASYKDELSGAELELSQFEAAQARAAEATKDQYESATEAAGRLEALRDAQADAEEAARAHAEAMQDAADAAKAQADAFRAATDAGFALRAAQRDARDAGDDLRTTHRDNQRAVLDAADAQTHLNEVLEDEESTAADIKRARLDLADAAARVADSDDEIAAAQDRVLTSADAVADATVRQVQERRAARGETTSATQALDVFNRSLLDQAAAASGPVRKALIDHVAALNGIPPKKASQILALLDEGKRQKAINLLNRASDPREATITADAETAAAQAELDQLDNPRTMDLIVNPRLGGPIPRFASGGTTDSSGLALVGEQGPELAMFPAGTQIHTAGRTRSFLSRVRGITGRARSDAARAVALREQAAAAKDAEEQERLLAEAEDAAEQSAQRASKAADLVSEALREQADTIRETAAEWVEAQRAMADADRERSSSLLDAVDAVLALEDARASAAEAFGHAARAFTVEGVTREQQQAAINDAQQAALALARAQVEAARTRAQGAGREFTEADAAREMQRVLLDAARQGGPVGAAIQALIRQLNFPQQIALAERAERRDAKADRREDRSDKRADKLDRAADKSIAAADRYERVIDKLIWAMVEGASDARIRAILAEITRGARAGRR